MNLSFFCFCICHKIGCTLKRSSYLSFSFPSYSSLILSFSPYLIYFKNSIAFTELQEFASFPFCIFKFCVLLKLYCHHVSHLYLMWGDFLLTMASGLKCPLWHSERTSPNLVWLYLHESLIPSPLSSPTRTGSSWVHAPTPGPYTLVLIHVLVCTLFLNSSNVPSPLHLLLYLFF